MYIDRLIANRSKEQLNGDKARLKEMLEENKVDIDKISDNLLSMIVMIKKDELTAL